MDIETLRAYCLQKKDAVEEFPFGNATMVFKVQGKMFLAAGLNNAPLQFNVKCDPEIIPELRERYAAVRPGYHMNKNHWNTVIVDGSIPEALLKSMIDDSYSLIINSLPKKVIPKKSVSLKKKRARR